MTRRQSPIKWFYDRIVLAHPIIVLVCFFAILAVLSVFATRFKIEASSDTLIQQENKHYQYYQKTISRYGYNDFLLITYTPDSGDLLNEQTLSRIAALKADVEAIDRVSSVVTVLDIPLLESPPMPIRELIDNMRTLKSPGVDMEMARQELKTSPLYKNLLVSPDLKTTALQINFKIDPAYMALWQKHQDLLQDKRSNGLSSPQKAQLQQTSARMDDYYAVLEKQRQKDIDSIREIMRHYEDDADLFLGGLSMVATDLMRFIRNDLKVYGLGVFYILMLTLGLIFQRIRWIALPLLSCGFSVLAMVGLLGMFGWKVTVVSSNFISLQLIITMAISIHLTVRYRELITDNPEQSHWQLTRDMVIAMKTPCFYAALTTIAGFGSLLLADIKPVETFGWMMSAGIVVSLVVTFIFFPAALVLFVKAPPPKGGGARLALTKVLARFTQRHGRLILGVSLAALVISVAGISRLEVENAFINYFKSSTEIYQGMKVIDEQLGGTTPLDVIIDFEEAADDAGEDPSAAAAAGDVDEGFGEFDAFAEFETEADPEKYWFTPYRLSRIEAVHDYLDGLDHTGKVLSLAVLKKVAERITDGPLDTFELSLLFNQFPEKYREMLIAPFVSTEHNQARISLRIIDSHPSLRRNALIQNINHDLTHQLEFAPGSVHLTGMLILYNDVLQSLFESQILTLGLVVLALMIMFMILFRSVKISLIALFPNLLATGVVLGAMGWLKIPLDIMTITIASISVGIAVDDTIHYIHRFRKEMRKDRSYINAMHRCHGSIGYAMYYTSLTIIIGFSILATSNFIPTIIFGLFTGLAMLIALIAALTLLPQLIIWIKPFGPEGNAAPR